MDDLFFILSKLIWAFVRPDHLLLLLLTLAVLVLGWNSPKRKAWRSAMVLLGIIWLVALFPIGRMLMHPLEQQFMPPQQLDQSRLAGIIVLGGAESLSAMRYRQRAEFTEAAERVMVVPTLAEQFPELPIIYTCGSGWLLEPDIRGADYTKLYFDAMGLDGRVLYERESRNTYENASLSIPLAGERFEGTWLLVTSAFHMPRSVGVFRQQGWKVLPYPVDFRGQPFELTDYFFSLSSNLEDLTMAVREWTGLLAYRLSGKTYQLLPGELAGG
ncbi:MAG: YdcF family protein [Halopseudomonas sp.]